MSKLSLQGRCRVKIHLNGLKAVLNGRKCADLDRCINFGQAGTLSRPLLLVKMCVNRKFTL
ncbi:MAG: hypothetical protein AABZ55_06485, partial [Bdellovibrionota bacterium]